MARRNKRISTPVFVGLTIAAIGSRIECLS
jgi:hypothetical protein